MINGVELWIEPDGYSVEMKFVRKFPALFGPLAVDPDHGQGDVECDDAAAKILNKLTGFGGTYSTWAERHCSLTAIAIARDIKTSADVPPCPKFWLAENQYWVTHIAIGRLDDKNETLHTFAGLLQDPAILTRISAIATAAAAAGAVALPPLIQYISKLLGN